MFSPHMRTIVFALEMNMTRSIDLIYVVALLVVAIPALCALYKKPRITKWSRKAKLCAGSFVALVVVTVACFVWAPQADADEAAGVVTHSNQFPLKLPGDYKVNLGKRCFLVHLPPGYDDNQDRLPVAFVLHGGHEENPTHWALRQTQMNATADQHKFICVYPRAQALYTAWGTPFHAWNSPLGTLGEFNSRFEDDAQYLENVYDWVMSNTRADKNNFTLVGCSEGGLMANDLAQTGKLHMKWLVTVGGTMLIGQDARHPHEDGPENVLIQLNTEDAWVLPNETDDGQVVRGGIYLKATYGAGFWNMANSKPRMQIRFWLEDGGRVDNVDKFADPAGNWQCDIYTVGRPNGKVRRIVVAWVKGGHAWHGSPEGGDVDDDIPPNMGVPLNDWIANCVTTDAAPIVKQ
jgi:poly(3-hydroxybutyrate) depolymerase